MLLYADKDFSLPVVEQLRTFGHDVVTTQEDGRASAPDADIVARAHSSSNEWIKKRSWPFKGPKEIRNASECQTGRNALVMAALRGIIHGKIIELDQESGLPDGEV